MKSVITFYDLEQIDEARAVKVDIPESCEKCGLMNSENCNTCSALEKFGYEFETGV